MDQNQTNQDELVKQRRINLEKGRAKRMKNKKDNPKIVPADSSDSEDLEDELLTLKRQASTTRSMIRHLEHEKKMKVLSQQY
jgi:hypothetical protein